MSGRACFDKQYVWRFVPQSDPAFEIEHRIAKRFFSHRRLISANTLIQDRKHCMGHRKRVSWRNIVLFSLGIKSKQLCVPFLSCRRRNTCEFAKCLRNIATFFGKLLVFCVWLGAPP